MLQAQAMGNEEACRKRKTTGVEFGGGDSGISPFFHGIKMFSMDKSLREKKWKLPLVRFCTVTSDSDTVKKAW